MLRTVITTALTVVLLLPRAWHAQTPTAEIVELPGFAFKYSAATAASKRTVWQLWTDVDNWNTFDTLLEYSRLEPGVAFGEGATGRLKAEGAPRTRFEIINVDSPRSFTVRLKLPLWQVIDQQRYFEDSDNGQTVFTHEIHFRGGLKPLLWVMLGGIYKRETAAVVENLKAAAEGRENF